MDIDWDAVVRTPFSVQLPTWQSIVRQTAIDFQEQGATAIKLTALRSIVVIEATFESFKEVARVEKPLPPPPVDDDEQSTNPPPARCTAPDCTDIGPLGQFCTNPSCLDSGNIYGDQLRPANQAAYDQE